MSQLCLLAASLVAQGQAPGWQLAVTPTIDPARPRASSHAELCQTKKKLATQTSVAQVEQDSPIVRQALQRPEFSPVSPVIGIASSVSASARPNSSSQLYQQRVAALRSGRLYPRIPVNGFQSAWQNAVRQPTYEDWTRLLRQEAQVMARSQSSNRLTVLFGDSLSLWFPIDRLPTDRFWLNQSISGDTTAGMLRRISSFNQTRPDRIYVMAGINDLRRGASDRTVLENQRQIIQRLRQAHPQATIVVYSILPTRLPALPSDRIRQLNANLAAVSRQEGANFYDLQTHFAGTDGSLRRELTTDGLHLSRRGYEVWQLAMTALR